MVVNFFRKGTSDSWKPWLHATMSAPENKIANCSWTVWDSHYLYLVINVSLYNEHCDFLFTCFAWGCGHTIVTHMVIVYCLHSQMQVWEKLKVHEMSTLILGIHNLTHSSNVCIIIKIQFTSLSPYFIFYWNIARQTGTFTFRISCSNGLEAKQSEQNNERMMTSLKTHNLILFSDSFNPCYG